MNLPSLLVIATFVFTAMSAAAFAFQPPPPGQDGFIAAKDLPQAESIPAAPLLVAAYAIIWSRRSFFWDDLAPSQYGRSRHSHVGKDGEVDRAVTAGHFIFIPSVPLVAS
jgi:hypothetical protein